MSLPELEVRVASLKEKATGDVLDLVHHIEATFQHLQMSHVENIVKDAVYDSLKNAAIKLENIVNNGATLVAKEAEAVSAVAEKVVRKTASRKQSTTE